MQASDKLLRILSLFVKAKSDKGVSTFRDRDYLVIHDQLVKTYRKVKELEQRPEILLDRWVKKGG